MDPYGFLLIPMDFCGFLWIMITLYFLCRKITLPDCSAHLLSLFLRYLYGDHIDPLKQSNEQLIELLIMADRFEVEQLSISCQTVLTSRLDNSNVLCMLAVADQWTATQLQVFFLDS